MTFLLIIIAVFLGIIAVSAVYGRDVAADGIDKTIRFAKTLALWCVRAILAAIAIGLVIWAGVAAWEWIVAHPKERNAVLVPACLAIVIAVRSYYDGKHPKTK